MFVPKKIPQKKGGGKNLAEPGRKSFFLENVILFFPDLKGSTSLSSSEDSESDVSFGGELSDSGNGKYSFSSISNSFAFSCIIVFSLSSFYGLYNCIVYTQLPF